MPLFQYFNLTGRFLLFLGSFLNFPFSDVFQSEMWCEFLASKAEGTIRTYLAGFKRWKLWALSNCFHHIPDNSFNVAAYLPCPIFEANYLSPVLNAVYGTVKTRV